VALDEAAATAVTAQMLGTDEPPAREAVLDMVREIVSQAVGAVALKPVARGLRLSVSPVTLAEALSPAGEAQARQLTVAVLPAPMTFVAWGEPVPAVAAAPPAAAAAAPRTGGHAHERIDVILDIELPLVVRFGRTELPLKTLMRLGPGSVIDLGRSPDEPVEVVVSNRVVARGEVVIVGGNYGIRILDVISPTERIRSMEV
jgi:flagellar motor switch protein FliN/FliY